MDKLRGCKPTNMEAISGYYENKANISLIIVQRKVDDTSTRKYWRKMIKC